MEEIEEVEKTKLTNNSYRFSRAPGLDHKERVKQNLERGLRYFGARSIFQLDNDVSPSQHVERGGLWLAKKGMVVAVQETDASQGVRRIA